MNSARSFERDYLRMGLRAVAVLTAAWFAFHALADVTNPRVYDFWWYQLPFALKRAGLTTMTFGSFLGPRFDGFPPLANLLQAGLIHLTDRIASANLVGLAGVALLGMAAKFVFRESFSVSLAWLLLLTAPIAAAHLSIGYVDLFTGCCLGVAFLGLQKLTAHRPAGLALMALGGGAACLSKFQAWPIALLFAIAAIARLRIDGLAWARVALCAVVLFGALGIWPVRNLVLLGNPTYPFAAPFVPQSIGLTVAEVPPPDDNLPARFLAWPRPVVTVLSAFDVPMVIKAREESSLWENFFWAFDQAEGIGSAGHRMGGWLLMLPALGLILLRSARRGRLDPVALSALGASLGVVAILPQGHELRYWMFVPAILAVQASVELTVSWWDKRFRTAALIYLVICLPASLIGIRAWEIDLRDIPDRAPAEAVAYWSTRAEDPGRLDTVSVPPNAALFWAGPSFNSFRIVNETEE